MLCNFQARRVYKLSKVIKQSAFKVPNYFSVYSIRTFTTSIESRDVKVQNYSTAKDESIISQLDTILNKTTDSREVGKYLKGLTHPRAFNAYTENQNALSLTLGSSNLRNHIMYNVLVAKKNPKLIENVLNSGLKLLENCMAQAKTGMKVI